MDTDRAAAQLLPVPDHVVGLGAGRAGVVGVELAGGRGERDGAARPSASRPRSTPSAASRRSRPGGSRPRRSARSVSPRSSRICPSTASVTGRLSATSSSRSPSSAPRRRLRSASSASLRNFAVGERQPSPSRKAQTSPFAPSSWAREIRPSSSERGISRRPALMPRIEPPPSSTERKTLNSVSRRASPRSTSSSPKRRSGRSVPKRSIASS